MTGPAPDVGAFEVQVVANRAPVAAPDSYLTNEDTPLNTPARGVLANDSDLDGDLLTAAVATGPKTVRSSSGSPSTAPETVAAASATTSS